MDRWLVGGEFPEGAARAHRPHGLDPFADYRIARDDAGPDNAAHLTHDLQQRGCTSSEPAVRRDLAEFRRIRPRGGLSAPCVPAPSPRATAWLLRKADTRPDALRSEEQAYVTALCAACPPLVDARGVAPAFVQRLTPREANALDPWLFATDSTERRVCARGRRRDHDAVLAAILFPWSNGQVEGHVHRLKLIKRTMYGRASLGLLRRRVPPAA